MSISENLLQAMDIIANEKIKSVSFDQTIVCTIEDDSDREKGHYKVNDGKVKFDAYCESTKYRNKQQVYVLIPGGDYSNPQKTIISKYNSKADKEPITYVSPFEQLVIMNYDNIISSYYDDIGEKSIRANGFNEDIDGNKTPALLKELYSFDINTDPLQIKYPTRTCNAIGIKCAFKCLLQNYFIANGEYGLAFTFYDKNMGDMSFEEKLKYQNKVTLKFSNKELFGNSYGLITYLPQESKLDISTIDFTIKHIDINLYQDGKFQESGKDTLLDPNPNIDDIYVKDLELYFANDMSRIENETFRIYCDNLNYGIIKEDENSRFIYSKWFNKDFNNKSLGYTDSEDYRIEWLRFNNDKWEIYKDYITFMEPSQVANRSNYIYLRKNLKREQIKAILYKEGVPHESNILTFENKNINDNPLAADQKASLEIIPGKNTKLDYPLYDNDNVVINPIDVYLRRELYLDIKNLQLNIPKEVFFKDSTFYWYIPLKDTLLVYNEDELKEKGYSKVEDSEMSKEGMICFMSSGYKPFYFQISRIYSKTYINNNIECIAIYNDLDYHASINFKFSSFGNNNNSYSLIIKPLNKEPGFINGNNYQLEAELYDAGQNKVILSEEDKKHIIWTRVDDKDFQPINGNILSIKNYENNKYNVYQAHIELDNVEKQIFINLSTQYALPQTINQYYCGLTPIEILYNSDGTSPKYYKDNFKLFDVKNNVEIEVYQWRLKYYYAPEVSEKDYLPYIKNNSLFAQKLYVQDLLSRISMVAYDVFDNVLWEQPIIIAQNVHSSKVLNEWDGSLKIDEDGNYLLSAMVGAGKKNIDDNTFSGVLMGDISTSQGDNNNIGLYGYHHGAQSFGLNIDGTAFLGKNGKGRIEFDGNYGLIKSSKWDGRIDRENNTITSGTQGMAIDLESGHIDAFNFMLSANNLLLNSNPKDQEYYFFIGKDNNMISLKRDGDKAILDIHSNKFTLEAGKKYTDEYLGLFSADQDLATNINNSGDKKDWRIIAGKKFGVSKNGDVYGSNVYITGKVEANVGYIGNWTLEDKTNGGYLWAENNGKSTVISAPGSLWTSGDNPAGYVFTAGGKKDILLSNPFRIGANGKMYAEAGKIGNWNILKNYLYGENSGKYTYLATPGSLGDNYVFSAGQGSNYKNHPFRVKADGTLYAKAGEIGNWTIKNGYLYGVHNNKYTYIGAPGTIGDFIISAGSYNLSQGLKNNPFQVWTDGSLIATRGCIGGWTLSDSKLYAEASGGSIYISPLRKDINTGALLVEAPIINVGVRSEKSQSYFVVNGAGTMFAKNAVIEGSIYMGSKLLSGVKMPNTHYNIEFDSVDAGGTATLSGEIGYCYLNGIARPVFAGSPGGGSTSTEISVSYSKPRLQAWTEYNDCIGFIDVNQKPDWQDV